MKAVGSIRRVCVVGCGPSGMSALYQFEQLRRSGVDTPEVVCYEKQADWAGLWNYTWRTGVDADGETVVHSGMYTNLWSNSPKEGIEYPDYPFDKHFGKPTPSYPPRSIIRNYLEGRFNRFDLKTSVQFNSTVKNVVYDEKSKRFTVSVIEGGGGGVDESKPTTTTEFDMVIVAVGHFSVPNVAEFPGFNSFTGPLLHSHDFRHASNFKDMRVLVVGSSFSAEDIALQCVKYGSKSVIVSWRTKPQGYEWPDQIGERPLLARMEKNVAHFRDGSTAEVDAIILCTGYRHSYPFLDESLRLKTDNSFYPPNLYRGTLFSGGGGGRLLYLGASNQFFSLTMFDVQAAWAAGYATGTIRLPDKPGQKADMKKWADKLADAAKTEGNILCAMVDFQTDYVLDLAIEANYGYDLSAARHFYRATVNDRIDNIVTFRDKCFVGAHTGRMASKPRLSHMLAYDDSAEHFLA